MRQTFTYSPNTKTSDLTTQKFIFDKSCANAKIEVSSPVDNSWLWVAGDLVNNADGRTFPFEQSVEYYHGYDGGEYWSEGGQSRDQLISAVPGGEYYLNLDVESGDFKDSQPRTFTISVWRDISTCSNYFWCLSFLSALPLIVWIRMRRVEVARWSNSDYSPYVYHS
jgi:hypothetical protein